MKSRFIHLSILPCIYLLIVMATLIFMWHNAKHDAFCGLATLLVTLPWSMLFIFILDAIDKTLFNSSLIPGTAVLIISAFINAVLIFLLLKRIFPQKDA